MQKIAYSWSMFIALVLIGCSASDTNPDPRISVGRDYYRLLPNGYKLCDYGGSDIFLSNSNDVVEAGPTIEVYSHSNGFIYGRIINNKLTGNDQRGIPGHFIVNINGGEVLLGLDEIEWVQLLKDKNISSVYPAMRIP